MYKCILCTDCLVGMRMQLRESRGLTIRTRLFLVLKCTVQALTPTSDKSGSMQKPRNEVGPALDVNIDKQILRVEENPEISSRRLAATIKERKHELQTFHTKK